MKVEISQCESASDTGETIIPGPVLNKGGNEPRDTRIRHRARGATAAVRRSDNISSRHFLMQQAEARSQKDAPLARKCVRPSAAPTEAAKSTGFPSVQPLFLPVQASDPVGMVDFSFTRIFTFTARVTE